MPTPELGRPNVNSKLTDDYGSLTPTWSRFFIAIYTYLITIIPIQPGGLQIHANNTTARTAGLSPGQFYRSGGDPDIVYVVH